MSLNIESESVRAYLSSLQAVVSRMASNCANCKTWCVTIVSALLALALENGKPNALTAAYLPLSLFFFLDAYYLSLERDFVVMYSSFVTKLHASQVEQKEIYNLTPPPGLLHRMAGTLGGVFSFSTIPFYAVVAGALIAAKRMLGG